MPAVCPHTQTPSPRAAGNRVAWLLPRLLSLPRLNGASALHNVPEVPQIPSIQYWRRSRGGTSERGAESAQPHFRGLFERGKNRRLIVAMTHNTDIADGWEREGQGDEYFYRFSVKAYPLELIWFSMP